MHLALKRWGEFLQQEDWKVNICVIFLPKRIWKWCYFIFHYSGPLKITEHYFVSLQNEITSSPSEAETVFLTPEPNKTKELKMNEALIQSISIHLYVICLQFLPTTPPSPPKERICHFSIFYFKAKTRMGEGVIIRRWGRKQ